MSFLDSSRVFGLLLGGLICIALIIYDAKKREDEKMKSGGEKMVDGTLTIHK